MASNKGTSPMVDNKKEFKRTRRCNYYKQLLLTKHLPEVNLTKYDAEEFNFQRDIVPKGFLHPFIVEGMSDKFGLRLPSRQTSMKEIANLVGNRKSVRLIEVGTQTEIMGYTIQQYAQYLDHVSAVQHPENYHLSSQVEAPAFVNEIDWVRAIWPVNELASARFARVQKYCLAGMAGSYTDFHIDFGGTSVWYHILWGKKRFFLIPPTMENLKIFEQWTCSPKQSTTFLGDLVPEGQCFYFDLSPGMTFIIPSGWIHSVYTAEDSLVFGGNFLHTYSILSQLQANCIETRTKVSKAFMFPQFRLSHWFFLCEVLKLAQERCKLLNENPDSNGCDEAEMQQIICKNLQQSNVLLQVAVLLKIFEKQWLARTDAESMEAYKKGAHQFDHDPYLVIDSWWKVLEVMSQHAAFLRSAAARCFGYNGQQFTSLLDFVKYLHTVSSLDLFDEKLFLSVYDGTSSQSKPWVFSHDVLGVLMEELTVQAFDPSSAYAAYTLYDKNLVDSTPSTGSVASEDKKTATPKTRGKSLAKDFIEENMELDTEDNDQDAVDGDATVSEPDDAGENAEENSSTESNDDWIREASKPRSGRRKRDLSDDELSLENGGPKIKSAAVKRRSSKEVVAIPLGYVEKVSGSVHNHSNEAILQIVPKTEKPAAKNKQQIGSRKSLLKIVNKGRR